MRPLAELNARGVRTVLVDIDETLTTAGKLTADAYTALERLYAAGRIVVPVTGRPAGWCDHIARMWPVNAVVGENGAFYFFFSEGRLHKRFVDDAPARARKRTRLDGIARRILAEVPGCALAADQPSSPRCPAARSPPISLTARPTSRSTTAKTCRRSHSTPRNALRS